MILKAWKDRILAKIFIRHPSLVERWAKSTKFIINLADPEGHRSRGDSNDLYIAKPNNYRAGKAAEGAVPKVLIRAPHG